LHFIASAHLSILKDYETNHPPILIYKSKPFKVGKGSRGKRWQEPDIANAVWKNRHSCSTETLYSTLDTQNLHLFRQLQHIPTQLNCCHDLNLDNCWQHFKTKKLAFWNNPIYLLNSEHVL